MKSLSCVNTEVLIPIIVTVVSGVLVFLVGEILTSIWLTPLQQYKELKKRITYYLSYYSNIFTNVIDFADYKDNTEDDFYRAHVVGSDEIRKLSCELKGFIETLSHVKFGISKKKDLKEAADLLMLISNSFFTPYNDKSNITSQNKANHNTAKEIKKLLGCYGMRTHKKKEKCGEDNEV